MLCYNRNSSICLVRTHGRTDNNFTTKHTENKIMALLDLSFAIVAIFLLGCQSCFCKELPKVEETENTPEMIEAFEGTPEMIEAFEDTQKMMDNLCKKAMQFATFENSIQQLDEADIEKISDIQTINENRPKPPGGPIQCYAGVMETPIQLPCYGSCVTAFLDGKKSGIGCSTTHMKNGCHKKGFLKLCFCNRELCNSP